MAASGDDSTSSPDDLPSPEKLRAIFDKYPEIGKEKTIPFYLTEMSGSMPDEIFAHEIPDEYITKNYPPMPIGKTESIEKISKIFNDKILRIDASDYIPKKFDKNLEDLLGAPPGYLRPRPKLKLTPDHQQALNEALAETREYLDRDNSRTSGERLAAACHSGIAAPTTAMKPLRFRGAGGSTFAVAGAMWS